MDVKLDVLPEVGVLLVYEIGLAAVVAQRPYHHRNVLKRESTRVEAACYDGLDLCVEEVAVLAFGDHRGRSDGEEPGDESDVFGLVVEDVLEDPGLDPVDQFRSDKVGLVAGHVDGGKQLVLHFSCAGIVLYLSLSVDDLLALEHLVDGQCDDGQELVVGQAGGETQDLPLVLPRDLEVQQLDPRHELLHQSFREGFGL